MSHQDFQTIQALDETIGTAAGDEYEHLIRTQATRDTAFHRNIDTAPVETLENAHGVRTARWSHGAGGGRTRTPEFKEEAYV